MRHCQRLQEHGDRRQCHFNFSNCVSEDCVVVKNKSIRTQQSNQGDNDKPSKTFLSFVMKAKNEIIGDNKGLLFFSHWSHVLTGCLQVCSDISHLTARLSCVYICNKSCWARRSDKFVPERSCLMRPLLLLMSTGSMSLYHEISGSGFPPAAHSIVAVRVFSTTFSWGPMSMVGKPGGIWFSENM